MTRTTTRPPRRQAAGKKGTPQKQTASGFKQAASARRSAADPRIAARRREVVKTEGRKRLRLLIALSVITLASIGSLVLLKSSWLDIDEIIVVGGERTDPDLVRSASGISVATPLVDLDLAASEEAVEALPWVATASVSREWNGTITVSITERMAAIALPTVDPEADGFMLVDVAGRQLGSVAARPDWAHVINGLVSMACQDNQHPQKCTVSSVYCLSLLLTISVASPRFRWSIVTSSSTWSRGETWTSATTTD